MRVSAAVRAVAIGLHRTTPAIATGDERYAWLNTTVRIATGNLSDAGVSCDVLASSDPVHVLDVIGSPKPGASISPQVVAAFLLSSSCCAVFVV